MAVDSRHPAPRGRPPLPGEWRQRYGHVAHRRLEPVAPGRGPVNPGWLAGGDARHHGALLAMANRRSKAKQFMTLKISPAKNSCAMQANCEHAEAVVLIFAN